MKKVKHKICLRIREKLEGIRKQTKNCTVKLVVRYQFQVSMFSEQLQWTLLHVHVSIDGGL